MIRQNGSRTLRVSETRTFFFSDFCLQVVGVYIDKILFLAFALPAAEAAAAQTAAACENAAAHHKSLNIVVWGGGGEGFWNNLKWTLLHVVSVSFLNQSIFFPTLNQHLDMRK